MIIDYSTARPSAAALKAAGVTAVGRYIGWDSVPGFSSIGKNLTKAEAEHLISHGFEIFLAFEYEAKAALKGRGQGISDGRLAAEQLRELGAPPGMTVYFALDFDIGDFAPHLPAGTASARAKLGPAAAYFDGIRSTKPAYAVGGYGGYWAVSRLFDAGLIEMGWQTLAWSGTPTRWDERAVLRQHLGTPLPGADLDTVREHTASGRDFGQWPRLRPPASDYVTHKATGTETAHDVAARHGESVTRMLTDSLKHFQPAKANAPELYEWVNGCFDPQSFTDAKADVAAGVTFRVPRLPS